MQRKGTILLVIVASLPVLLPLYNPSLELGGVGIFLGFWGTVISPIVIFGFLFYLFFQKRDTKM
jgi:hypothetical protein